MKLKKLKDWNLKSKLIFYVILIGALTVAFLSYFCTRSQRAIIQALSQQKAELVGAIIENSIFTSMREGKSEEVQSILRRISLSEDIQNIRILSPEGKILSSSTKEEIGESPEENSLQSLKEFLSTKRPAGISFPKPAARIRGYRAIENRKECYSCHGTQNRINGVLEVDMDYSGVITILRQNQARGAGISLIALIVVTFVILRLFDKLINQPLSRLKKEMKKVQEGDLDIQIHTPKQDEIGSLAESFQVMVANLKEANKKIKELFDKQMEKAEHLASIGELAAGLAHEIKNPIAGMKGALEVISQKTDASDPKKEIFAEMLLQIDRIDHIIQDLLSYARPKDMILKPANPNDCVVNAMKLAKPHLKNKGIRFDFKGMPAETRVCLDADKIQEVLLNLMLNSISAIEKKGTISIRVSQKDEKALEIIFKDNGKGIKKEHLNQIFIPFFTTKSRGTGLGLSICKKIIEAHKGTIAVETEEQKGTTFFIHLPFLQTCD